MRAFFWWAVVAPVIVLGSFFGTLYVIDHYPGYYTESQLRDRQRASETASIREALEKYKAAKGAYPSPFSDNPLSDLKKALVDGGYLRSIPVDPETGKEYRYVSLGGAYGLLVPTGCMTGVKAAKTGWWGQPPDCPF